MNLPLFIARRVALESRRGFGRTILRIAVAAVALCVAVMILTNALITGFKTEVSEKIFGFWGHIHVTQTGVNRGALELDPIDRNQDFYPHIDTTGSVRYLEPVGGDDFDPIYRERFTRGGIRHIQTFALKPGIIKSKEQIEGIVLKGVGTDFDWGFFQQYLIAGDTLDVHGDKMSNGILLSETTAARLDVTVGDKFIAHFVQNNDQLRRAFRVDGIYRTGLAEFENKLALVDLRKIQQLLGWEEDQVGGFEVFVEDLRDLEPLTEYLYYEVVPADLYAESVRRKFPNLFEWLELQNINEYVILGLMLVVGIINMITALLILILERTNMIGTLKALGATDWTIRRIFLYYAAYILGWGLLLGNGLGFLLGFLQDYFEIIKLSEEDYILDVAPVHFNWMTVLLLNVGTLVITLLFLVIPTALVSRISPVRAIRFK